MSGTVRSYSPEVMRQAMAQAHDLIEEFAETMADRARDLAPPPPKFGTDTATGHNRDSINFEMTGETKARVFTESGYGGWLEIGTTKMAARPYFRPAFEATRKELNG